MANPLLVEPTQARAHTPTDFLGFREDWDSGGGVVEVEEGRGRRELCLRAEASSLLATLGVSIVQEALMEKETLRLPGSACQGPSSD